MKHILVNWCFLHSIDRIQNSIGELPASLSPLLNKMIFDRTTLSMQWFLNIEYLTSNPDQIRPYTPDLEI